MTCRDLFQPFNRAHVGVAWMLAAGIICAGVLWLAGCAIEPNGTISPFEGLDHGCQIDPQSCR